MGRMSFARFTRGAAVLAVAGAILGCSAVGAQAAMPAGTPIGNLDKVVALPGGARVVGWAWDSSTSAPVTVAVTTPVSASVVANGYRADVARVYPKAGAYRGFDTVLTLPAGTHEVCVSAKNVGSGVDRSFPCRTVTVAPIATVPTAGTTTGATTPPTDSTTPTTTTAPTTSTFGAPVTATTTALNALGWRGKEEAAVGRVSVLGGTYVPGSGRYKPATAIRFNLRNGDVTTTGTYQAPRTEVFGRQPLKLTDSYTTWPDPAGSTRWYRLNFYVPADFPTATDTRWLTLTQWKGLNGGSPPIALEVKRDTLRLGGTRTNAGAFPNEGTLGTLVKGQWNEIIVGMHHSNDRTKGWVEVYRDGVKKLPKTYVATMDTINGRPDPTYLKQGIYRAREWTVDHTVFFGPTTVSPSFIVPTP